MNRDYPLLVYAPCPEAMIRVAELKAGEADGLGKD
jgi:hypothetical protein